MLYILGRFKVEDVEAWKLMVESHRAGHLAAGLHFQQVWSTVDNPKEIFFLYTVEDLNNAKTFLQGAGALDRDKQQRGEIPELFFLQQR
jgi:hypothetical protein